MTLLAIILIGTMSYFSNNALIFPLINNKNYINNISNNNEVLSHEKNSNKENKSFLNERNNSHKKNVESLSDNNLSNIIKVKRNEIVVNNIM